MQIGGVELSEDDKRWLVQEGRRVGISRSELARRLCDRKGLKDALGRPRVVAARIDLCRHAKHGRLQLPPSPHPPPRPRRRRPAPMAPAGRGDTRKVLLDVGPLSLHRVRGPRDPWHEVWNRSMREQHYLGAGPLCGAQLRYVVTAGEEVVAAVSFSASALKLAVRDKFIGWSKEARRRWRPLVIAQSRFCMTVRARDLASKVQSMVLGQVADDWQEAYGLRPVLVESYVPEQRFSGTCYRASNWWDMGQTIGRGRQDRGRLMQAGIKRVFIYPLDRKHWRQKLCADPVTRLDPGLDWAEAEWGSAKLWDKRSRRRLVRLGRARFERMSANLPQTCGSRAATKAAYRLLSHPKASLEAFLSGHREATLSRAVGESVLLAIQDTTSLNYTSHQATEGLGPIASNGAEATLGLEVHSLLLANTAGTPLGLLDIQAWARDPEEYGKSRERRERAIEEKESQKWLRGYDVADKAARRLDGPKVVVVGDREADMFDLFARAVSGRAQVLVRARHPRRVLTKDDKIGGPLWDLVRRQPVAGSMEVLVPRKGMYRGRVAKLELRYREARIRGRRGGDGPGSVRIWAVAACESAETAEGEPIEWLLLTTLPVESVEAAEEKVRWYARRWLIEVYHKALKSGCRMERKQLATAQSLEAALAIDAVVAWRVMALMLMSRELPDIPCTVFFEDNEWKALCCFVNRTPKPPKKPPTLREFVRMVGGLGGYLGRKGDGEPGTQTLWRGIERMTDIRDTYVIFFSSG